MNKISCLIVLAAALLCMSGKSEAAWFQVYSDATLTYYVDPSTARRVGSRVIFADLIDYKQIRITSELSPYLSMQTRSEFDCEQEVARWLYASFHRDHMGRGALVEITANPEPDEQWRMTTPGSLGEIRWTFACVQLQW